MRCKPTKSMLLAFVILANMISATAQADALKDWSLGIGKSLVYVSPAKAYSRTEHVEHFGWLGSIQYSPFEHFATRAHVYHFDGDHQVQGWGKELQALAGFNFNNDGVRAYTGPIWFHENRKDTTVIQSSSKIFSGLGWAFGSGLKWKQWSIDLSISIRQNATYVDYYENKYTIQKSDEVGAISAYGILSYQL